MNISEYRTAFGPEIQIQMNWATLEELNCQIRQVIVELPYNSGTLYTPWYTNSSGVPRKFSDPDANPLTVSAAAKNPGIITYQQVRQIYTGNLSCLEFPAYQLPDNRLLLLDGNHRTVSTVIEGRSITIMLFVLDGPVQKQILPDLGHWEQTE